MGAQPPHWADAVELSLPFTGPWRTQNSPARRVPSHGSDLFAERYAIDFIAVDHRGRTAQRRDWRTMLATEPPGRFVGFGLPLLAPAAGRVATAHDGEPDHEARRSQLALVPYALGQAARVRQGVPAIAGNFVIIETAPRVFVAMVHLQQGSLRVRPGDRVHEGQPVASCGNSGNSTQPHLHLQAMDSPDLSVARGLRFVFRRFRERLGGAVRIRRLAVPGEGVVVEPDRADDNVR